MIGHATPPRQMVAVPSSLRCPSIGARQTTALKGAVVSVAASRWLAVATVATCRALSWSVPDGHIVKLAQVSAAAVMIRLRSRHRWMDSHFTSNRESGRLGRYRA